MHFISVKITKENFTASKTRDTLSEAMTNTSLITASTEFQKA